MEDQERAKGMVTGWGWGAKWVGGRKKPGSKEGPEEGSEEGLNGALIQN